LNSVGGPAGIRTQTLPILSRLPLPVGLRGLVVGVPGFEPGRSNGALCSTGRRGQPYPPDTRTFLLTSLAESLGIEPSRA
jgi:hypothetical protein